MFPVGYDYRSVEVNGTEYNDVAVPLIYMAAGLQIGYGAHLENTDTHGNYVYVLCN